ncbi:MAG: HEAT repeat domain-containing protein [Oscillospiraceae bacterium]|jgi:hypothetical protein|nr:HEAT repeat domain-containing protein [Oscillospiraceae bacterium]
MTRRTLGYFNYVLAFLMIALFVLQLFPFIHYVDGEGVEQSVSILGYVVRPYIFKDMDNYLKDTVIPDFNTGYAMFVGAVVPILAVVFAIYLLRKKNLAALIFAVVWGALAFLGYILSPYCRQGGAMFIVHLVIIVLELALAIFCLITYLKIPKTVDNDREETFENDPRAAAKLAAIEKAIDKKDVNTLLDYAVSKDKSIRLKAVEGLGNVGGEGAFNLLVPMLRNTDVECRTAAAEALGKLGDARAVAFIYDRLERENVDSVREVLLASMAKLHTARAD